MKDDKEESCQHDIALLMNDGVCYKVCSKCFKVIS
jgi:hypothetical protein